MTSDPNGGPDSDPDVEPAESDTATVIGLPSPFEQPKAKSKETVPEDAPAEGESTARGLPAAEDPAAEANPPTGTSGAEGDGEPTAKRLAAVADPDASPVDGADLAPTRARYSLASAPRPEDPGATQPAGVPAFRRAALAPLPPGDTTAPLGTPIPVAEPPPPAEGDPGATDPNGQPAFKAPAVSADELPEDPNATVLEFKAPAAFKRPTPVPAAPKPVSVRTKAAPKPEPEPEPAEEPQDSDDEEPPVQANGNATLMLGADSMVGPVKPKPARAGFFSRPLATAPADSETTGKISRDAELEDSFARKRRGMLFSSLAVAAVVALLLAVVFGGGAKPEKEDLLLGYPYGAEGARGPKGELAPPATKVEFKAEGEVECGMERCLRYRYTKDDFTGTMIMAKDAKGWSRLTDDGMPFRIVVK